MCRHQAWLGQPRSLSQLVLEPDRGLLRQSWEPRRQKHGLMNADGWGVGYFTEGRAVPARWRSAAPLWHDASFASVAPTISSTAVLAAVRSASPGMPLEMTATAPFTDGTWLCSLNGRVDRHVLPATHAAESVCDAAILAAHVFHHGVHRLATTVVEVGTADTSADLNLLLTDGRSIVATTWGNSLSYLVEPDGVVVASEPWDDDPRWVEVPDRHHLVVTSDQITLTPLEA